MLRGVRGVCVCVCVCVMEVLLIVIVPCLSSQRRSNLVFFLPGLVILELARRWLLFGIRSCGKFGKTV